MKAQQNYSPALLQKIQCKTESKVNTKMLPREIKKNNALTEEKKFEINNLSWIYIININGAARMERGFLDQPKSCKKTEAIC